MIDGADILRTLVELLERQEQIKVTYTIKKREDKKEEEGDSSGRRQKVLLSKAER